jgi:hypothetical protein
LITEPESIVRRVEVCSIATVRRVAAMLDLDPATMEEGEYFQDIPIGATVYRKHSGGRPV